MSENINVEVWIGIDGQGNAFATTSEDMMTDEIPNWAETNEIRIAKIMVSISPPVVSEHEIDIPDDKTTIEVTAGGEA